MSEFTRRRFIGNRRDLIRKRQPASLERGTGKSHRRAIAAKTTATIVEYEKFHILQLSRHYIDRLCSGWLGSWSRRRIR